jgi:Pectinacetylesterase
MYRFQMAAVAILIAAPAFAKDTPAKGWNTIKPGGDTICADGSPYSFNVKRAASDRLVLFFNGGGACWSAETCNPKAERPVYFSTASFPGNNPAGRSGIFDATRPDNPLRKWSIVVVSYCTGDVHIGARRVTYGTGDNSFSIEHKGYRNATAALDWAFKHYPSAKSVLVTGSSAGAVAAPFYAGTVARRYPRARVSVLGDGAGAYRAAAIPAVFRSWGVEDIAPEWLRTLGNRPLNVETFYKVNAIAFPRVRQVQYNAAADAVQGNFLRMLGEQTEVEPALRANMIELSRDIPQFRSYIAPGTSHTVLGYPIFYDFAVEGVSPRRWVSDFVAGKSVNNVDCAKDAKGCTDPK